MTTEQEIERATEQDSESASLTCFTDFSIKALNIHRVACAIVSHSVEESGGNLDDGKTNEHLVDYAISKINELM